MHPKICLSIGNVTYEEALKHLSNVALAEIRMDLLNLPDEQLLTLFRLGRSTIATYRSHENFDRLEAKYNQAIGVGCTYVDIDINVPEDYRNRIAHLAHSAGCKVILSYHNYKETPDRKYLMHLIDSMRGSVADTVKIVCPANKPQDCSTILGLYDAYSNLVAFCMGEIGRITRLAAPFLGAPFTYASIEGMEVAPGQMNYGEMEDILRRMECDNPLFKSE
ncbi:MAG: type I 3-dehydroquinate dehydratase [Bacteroidales bacterium]|nr:type I 3-dehydroquinate dehydratase [Bacteroidales bacterium]